MSPNQQLNQILEEGFDSVAETGVRAFTVESLAKRLAMSKKTIYKFFPTKEKLIRSIMQFVFTQINSTFKRVMADESNPAVQFIKIMETITKFAGKAPLNKIAELKSLYPDIWKEIESFRLSHQEDFYTILYNAQEQGLARDDINMRSASIIYINIINSTFQPEFFLKNDLAIGETIRGFVQVVARGIFTDKGLKAIKGYHEQNSI
ncbi:MAG TPA: TetR/AcrR family transcriptional regulator [Candidatus Marinimicrobia bacterium]|jgi:AcrR family transcriptional regulator|nr:TetR/AcrR family transcriptional regulator [Candidatus Neomarinimicrobiota bacterium]HIN03254.1 TetR/AcrR family transcriptional regulator [Candidatus Neomarinimicrobiota bacterium]